MITSFNELRARLSSADSVSVAIASGNDENVLEALALAFAEKLVDSATVTGDRRLIRGKLPAEIAGSVKIVDADTPQESSALAVKAVRDDDADILIKGNVDSGSYLRAILDQEIGIRRNPVLSNVTVAELPSYPKLLGATDNGIVPSPDLEQKKYLIENTRHLYRGLGIASVKVAAVAATEKVTENLTSTTDAARLAEMSAKGQIPGFQVDGPFGYDVAVSREAARLKGLESSPVAGEADLMLFPTIDAANAVVKAWKYHGEAHTGSIVLGATVPVLLNSRSDSVPKRLNGLLLAMAERLG